MIERRESFPAKKVLGISTLVNIGTAKRINGKNIYPLSLDVPLTDTDDVPLRRHHIINLQQQVQSIKCVSAEQESQGNRYQSNQILARVC